MARLEPLLTGMPGDRELRLLLEQGEVPHLRDMLSLCRHAQAACSWDHTWTRALGIARGW